MNDELVSIVMPVYNGEKYLRDTVDSILHQSYSSFELILVNDGSTDDSFELMKSLAQSDKRIKIFSKKNGGVAQTRNFAISKAQGKYIAFCDQDDFWLENKLTKQMPLFKNTKVGLVYCGSILENTLLRKSNNVPFDFSYKGRVFNSLVQMNKISCCTVIVKKEDLLTVGCFDEDLKLMGVDDWHLWLKLSLVTIFDFVEEHLAIHVIHGSNYSLNEVKMHIAEIACVEKIKSINAGEYIVDWRQIENNIHIRYAKSYIFIGQYKEAGNAILQAHMSKSNFCKWLISQILKKTPHHVLSKLHAIKRKVI